MNKEELLKKSREENRYGDEREEKLRVSINQLNYLVLLLGMVSLVVLCYLDVISGTIVINKMQFDLENVLIMMMALSFLVDHIAKYIYFKKKFDLLIASIWLFILLLQAMILLKEIV